MKHCLLCLKSDIRRNDYISIESPLWSQLQIVEKIEKHFWPIDNVENVLGICFVCWPKLNDFNTFYRTIEEAHIRYINISKEEKSNCSIVQTSFPQLLKADLTFTEESDFAINEINDIKIEQTIIEDELLHCLPTTIAGIESNLNPLSTEKRKRGRPRKKLSMNETLTKKPKGKRGRPRKSILSKAVSDQSKYAHEHETLQDSGLVKDITKGSPSKTKRRRGRPRKIQLNKENPNSVKSVNVSSICINEVIKDNQLSLLQDEVNQDLTEKSTHKKMNFYSLIKKRKQLQQHKALMQNYIATSLRCMQFFRKD